MNPNPHTPALVDEDQDDNAAVASFVDALAEMVAANDPNATPEPIAAGTFAMYPTPDGGIMFVTDCPVGPMQGLNHTRIPPAMIRAVGVLVGGGSKMSALKALMGGKPSRKAIDGR